MISIWLRRPNVIDTDLICPLDWNREILDGVHVLFERKRL
jgi:hypothetical protein